MKTLDLKSIIDRNNLEVKEVAVELFPNNKYAKLALDRIIKGEAFLDTNQLSRLSQMTGITINELFEGGKWKLKSDDTMMTFEYGDFRAELNTSTWETKVYHKNSIFHESVLSKRTISLKEYLSELNKLITKYNK